MLLPTHLAAGQAAYLAACLATGHAPGLDESLIAIMAAALPDLDCRAGIVGRMAPPLSGWLERRFGHRTFTHSLILQVIAGAGLFYILPWGFFLALIAGWLSHTFTDMMTPAGVGWFWPSRVRCVLPGNERYRMKPMGWGELLFLIFIGFTGVLLHWLSVDNAGTTGVIRAAIGSLVTAREDYDAQKGGSSWFLRVEGRNNRTFQPIDGKYQVIGGYKESGFILEASTGPVSACKTESCDWYISHAVLVRGKTINTKTQSIRIGSTTADELAVRLAPWMAAGAVYLSGSFEARGIRPDPPTVETTGTEGVTLHYTSGTWLKNQGSLYMRNLDITVQLRTRGDELPDNVSISEENDTCLHPLLAKWVEETGKACQ